MAELSTLPRLLLRNAREMPQRTAVREKDRGIWQSWTWRDYHDHVRDFALGLAALGFTRGDKLSVIGDNRARLYAAQIAAQSLGGVSVPVYQDSIAKELAFVWNHADVSVIVAEDQEQVDKVLMLRDQLTLSKALGMVGGTRKDAKLSDIRIYRQKGNQPQDVLKVDFEAIKKNQRPDIFLQPYDVIEVSDTGVFGGGNWLQILAGIFLRSAPLPIPTP